MLASFFLEAPNFVMADLPYAIIVTGQGEVIEHKLANHNGKIIFILYLYTIHKIWLKANFRKLFNYH